MPNPIREKRLALGVSQREAERKLGLSHGTLASWEKGRRTPTAENIGRLALFFNCPAHELLPDMPKRLQSPILRKRLALGVSARAASKALGFSEGLISRWERGAERPSPKNAIILAQHLKCPVEEFFPEWKELNSMTRIMALRGFTPTQLGRALGISTEHVIGIAAGQKNVSIELADRIAGALSCTVQELGIAPKRHTGSERWKAVPPEVVAQRNELFHQYSRFIGWTMRKHTSMIRAANAETGDVWNSLAVALCKSLDRWILDVKSGEIANYIIASLKFALLAECSSAASRGITQAPRDIGRRICSLNALLDAGFQFGAKGQEGF